MHFATDKRRAFALETREKDDSSASLVLRFFSVSGGDGVCVSLKVSLRLEEGENLPGDVDGEGLENKLRLLPLLLRTLEQGVRGEADEDMASSGGKGRK